MTKQSDSAERRKTRAIARGFERAGYRVTSPVDKDVTPPFLSGFTPDLIAETSTDHVIVEVRSSDAVKGANDLGEVSKRVAEETGWRFELVTVKPERADAWPAAGLHPIVQRSRQCLIAGLPDVAYVYAWAGVEVMLTELSRRNRIRAGGISAAHLIQRLVVLGILSSGDADALAAALATRDQLVHARVSVPIDANDVDHLLSMGEKLERGLRVDAAA